MKQLILASGSPRRRELLSLYTTDFTVCASDFDESTVTADTPAELVEMLARGKCRAVSAQHPGAVTSPMVGTVYLQPEPGSEPFIRVGAQVTEGQTLLIIEAMKTMNQIPAPRAGTISRILVADGTPVEYGAPLVIIE